MYKQAVKKIKAGIMIQTNQSRALLKLMRKTPQNGNTFAEWLPKIKEQCKNVIRSIFLVISFFGQL